MLGWDRADLIARASEAVPAAAAELFHTAVAQRSRRRPLQHLTGKQAFWRHEFIVTPDVLIPRPETELLVERSLELLRDRPAPVIVDVGTGSGCIALSLAAERPDAQVHGVDLSPAALDVARGNAARLRLEPRVRFHQGDLLGPVLSLAGAVDLVVSNPPYVSAEEWTGLEPEVRDHEPRSALVAPGPVDHIYRRLSEEARPLLRPRGHLVVEVGRGRADMAVAAIAQGGLTPSGVHPDLAGIARVVHAVRPG